MAQCPVGQLPLSVLHYAGYTQSQAGRRQFRGQFHVGAEQQPVGLGSQLDARRADRGERCHTRTVLQENASTYAANLVLSYDTALDTIYTDWGKLQATGAKTADSDSGWSFSDQLTIDALGQELSAGVNRYIYLQLLPKFYQLDAYVSSPVSNSKKLGMYFISQQYEFGNQYSCSATYPASLPSAATMAYPHIGNTSSSDIFVIAGAINHQDTLNVSESLPSQSLITTLFAPDPNGSGTPTPGYLNLPMDPIYSNDGANGGFLTYRSGPTQGQGLCYDPGCVSHNPSNQCNAISSK